MGYDVSIYALKSKKELYIDREYNISLPFLVDEPFDIPEVLIRMYYDRLSPGKKVSKLELMDLAALSRKAWQTIGYFQEEQARNDAHGGIMTNLITFLEKLPDNEEFQMKNSCDDAPIREKFEFVDLAV